MTSSVVASTATAVYTTSAGTTTNTVTTAATTAVLATTSVTTTRPVTTVHYTTTATTTVGATVSSATPTGYLRARASPSGSTAGPVDGDWLTYSTSGSANGAVQMNMTSNSSAAIRFTLVSSPFGAYLKSADGAVFAAVNSWNNAVAGPSNGYDSVFAVTAAQSSGSTYAYLVCQDSTSPGGPLSCGTTRESNPSNNGTRTILQWCNTTHVVLDNVLETGCTALNLYWETTLPAYVLNTNRATYNYPKGQYMYIRNDSCFPNPMLIDWARYNMTNVSQLRTTYDNDEQAHGQYEHSSGTLFVLKNTALPWSGRYNETNIWNNWTINYASIQNMYPNDVPTSFLANWDFQDTNVTSGFDPIWLNNLFSPWPLYTAAYLATFYDDSPIVYPFLPSNTSTPHGPQNYDYSYIGFGMGTPLTYQVDPYLWATSLWAGGSDTDYYDAAWVGGPSFENSYNAVGAGAGVPGIIGECDLWSDGRVTCQDFNRYNNPYYDDLGASEYPIAYSVNKTRWQRCPATSATGQLIIAQIEPGGALDQERSTFPGHSYPGGYVPMPDNLDGFLLIQHDDPPAGCCDVELHLASSLAEIPNLVHA